MTSLQCAKVYESKQQTLRAMNVNLDLICVINSGWKLVLISLFDRWPSILQTARRSDNQKWRRCHSSGTHRWELQFWSQFWHIYSCVGKQIQLVHTVCVHLPLHQRQLVSSKNMNELCSMVSSPFCRFCFFFLSMNSMSIPQLQTGRWPHSQWKTSSIIETRWKHSPSLLF